MKRVKFLVLIFCFASIFVCCGCGDKNLPSAKIVRDDARIGGSLSFVYDKELRMIYIGGEDEVVQYSLEDETKGLTAGCKVGIKVTAPDESVDIENATLEMNGVNYSSGDFLESVDGQLQRFFNIYPTVSKKDASVPFTIKWSDGTAKQTYKIKMVDGTKYMNKDGTFE